VLFGDSSSDEYLGFIDYKTGNFIKPAGKGRKTGI
jgi:hypothetical protein